MLKLREELLAVEEDRLTGFIPRNVKSLVMKYMARTATENTRTGISNLGLIKLPDEIKNYVERIEFPIVFVIDERKEIPPIIFSAPI